MEQAIVRRERSGRMTDGGVEVICGEREADSVQEVGLHGGVGAQRMGFPGPLQRPCRTRCGRDGRPRWLVCRGANG